MSSTKTSTRPKSRILGWETTAQLQLHVEGHGLLLAVVVAKDPRMCGEWMVAALESPIESKSLEEIFDLHAHSVLPTQPDIATAIAFSEKYAKHWQRNRIMAREACACDEIPMDLRPDPGPSSGKTYLTPQDLKKRPKKED